MGGAVSSGRDNNELVDNLMGSNYIRTRSVELVFRALDRAEYMMPYERDRAYKDLAWRNGPLHLSAPCIYSQVLEGLQLKPGHTFLNIGSGTGYLSTMVGLLIGAAGVNHGVEVHPAAVRYSNQKLEEFMENSTVIDEFEFSEPKFYLGNGLCLAPLQAPYDRVYCGAGCNEQYENYFKQLIKVGGILVMPLNDNLIQVKRVSETKWVTKSLLSVSFASLRPPTEVETGNPVKVELQCPASLQALCRSCVRTGVRGALLARQPALRPAPRPAPPAKHPRTLCIPIEDDSDVDELNALHDLDPETGAHEMNALLSFVLSMGQNRAAGAPRFDSLDSLSESSYDSVDQDDLEEDDMPLDDEPDEEPPVAPRRPPVAPQRPPAAPQHPQRPPDPADDSCLRLSLTLKYDEPQPRCDASVATASTSPDDGPSSATQQISPEEQQNVETEAPAQVEVCLRSREADDSPPEELAMDQSSDEEGAAEQPVGARLKLDSGISDEVSTSSPHDSASPPGSVSPHDSASPHDSPRSEDSEDSEDSITIDLDEQDLRGPRRPKRGRRSSGVRKRRASSADGRRCELARGMIAAVRALPLPNELKLYVNLGRPFDDERPHRD